MSLKTLFLLLFFVLFQLYTTAYLGIVAGFIRSRHLLFCALLNSNFNEHSTPYPHFTLRSTSLHYSLQDYTPAVFRAVRALSNIEEADYMMALAGDFNYIEFIANSKSGEFVCQTMEIVCSGVVCVVYYGILTLFVSSKSTLSSSPMVSEYVSNNGVSVVCGMY